MNTSAAAAPYLNMAALLVLSDSRYPDDVVDWDLIGRPISSASVLLMGAYGPAAIRLLSMVAQEPGGPITRERLVELAPVAFGKVQDLNFAGEVITNYDLMLTVPHGFGEQLFRLAQLVPEVRQPAPGTELRG